MDVAVSKQFKGQSEHNKVKVVHFQHTAAVTVEKEPQMEEVGAGVKLLMIGQAKNPQNVCHVELTAGESAFHSPDAKKALLRVTRKSKTNATSRSTDGRHGLTTRI
jgi:hypothetical protein